MPDMWTALQFDNAVMTFGRHIEAKLSEFQDGRQVHNLRDLLDMPLTPAEMRERNRQSVMGLRMLARQRGSGVVIEGPKRKAK